MWAVKLQMNKQMQIWIVEWFGLEATLKII